jgi:hypothetical protein
VPERRSRAHWNTQEHVIAERKRREKMQQQFVALATIVPDLTKVHAMSGRSLYVCCSSVLVHSKPVAFG